MCSQEGLHTIELEDTRKDGWGTDDSYNKFYITKNGLVLFDIIYDSQTADRKPSIAKTFDTALDIPFNLHWNFSDVPQSDSSWRLPSNLC